VGLGVVPKTDLTSFIGLIGRRGAFNARKPSDDVQPVDCFRMNSRDQGIAREFGFEFDCGSAPALDEVEGFGAMVLRAPQTTLQTGDPASLIVG
jgi:hypothetical protein